MAWKDRLAALRDPDALLLIASTGVLASFVAPLADTVYYSGSLEPLYFRAGLSLAALAYLIGKQWLWFAASASGALPVACVAGVPPFAASAGCAAFAATRTLQLFGDSLWRGTAVAAGVAATAWAVSWAWRRLGLTAADGRRAFAAAAVLAAQAYLFYWLTRSWLRPAAGRSPVVFAGAFALLLAASIWPFVRRSARQAPAAFAAAALVACAWTPARALFGPDFPAAPAAAPGPRNIEHVVVILIDTLRADALSYRGAGAPPTPNIDALAAESVVFENALSPAPWTFASVHSILTGTAPYVDRESLTYPTAPLPTLPEFFADAGYRTAALSGNSLVDRLGGLARGFQEVDSYAANPLGPTRSGYVASWALESLEPETNTIAVTTAALRWLDDARDDPFFLWLHYYDPHAPYAPPERLRPAGRDESALTPPADSSLVPEEYRQPLERYYEAEVRLVDEHVGRVLDRLRRLHLYEESLIVLTSDHGEEFWEHGGQGHGHTLYNELLHVPLLIRPPGGARGERVLDYVPTQALTPTLLEAAGVAHERSTGWSESLTPQMEDPRRPYRQPFIASGVRRGVFQRAAVAEGWKLIRDVGSGEDRFFDLRVDPRERAPRPEPAQAAERLRTALDAHEARSARIRADYRLDQALTVDPAQLRKLRSMGYIR